eukprot:scaffold120012_cov60-Phaeocystis_antarctica.AAC.2
MITENTRPPHSRYHTSTIHGAVGASMRLPDRPTPSPPLTCTCAKHALLVAQGAVGASMRPPDRPTPIHVCACWAHELFMSWTTSAGQDTAASAAIEPYSARGPTYRRSESPGSSSTATNAPES